ncbi:MAG: hypothetical protein LBC89_05520 [Bacteroidales bacterium]|jgi:hypothetical protein|nr:hypothetical protein [Bacteroidales bacterium]
MKKLLIIFALCSLFFAQMSAQKLQIYKNAYVYGQSQRNKSDAGSALSLKDGYTYAMNDVVKKSNPKNIDIMLVYGKTSSKAEAGFKLFAPGMPVEGDIDWDKKSGTFPFRYFTASSKDPEGTAWLKNWATRNATKLQKVEGIDFDNATVESISAIDVKNEYITENLKEGDIVLFETAATSSTPSKKGLIKIGKIENDPNNEKGSEPAFQKMNLVVKMVK